MTTATIKKTTTDEANISQRTIRYEVYVNGQFDRVFDDVIEAMEYAAQF